MAKTTLNNVRIQLRNDTAANWAKSTVVLLAGEFAVENDTGLFKIGNGTDVFSALPYANNAAEVAQEFNALKDKIGEIPDDKTIIEMIQEASYDDTTIQASIAANKEAIDTLNGDGEGSVKKAIADAAANPLDITGATAGQVAKIKTVDADGKPTAWETIDIPGDSGLSGVTSVNGKTGAVTLVASDVITSSSDMNKVSINSDNTLEVNTISFDKIVQQDTDEIIISGGNA